LLHQRVFKLVQGYEDLNDPAAFTQDTLILLAIADIATS